MSRTVAVFNANGLEKSMKADSAVIDRLRIASPCVMNWTQMTGNDRVRFCDLCNLNVYNISGLTRPEVEALIAEAEGRICARLYRRADGTVITKDCPFGLRAIRRRAAKVAGAVFATLVSLCASVSAQKPSSKDKSSCRPQVMIKVDSQQEAGTVSGKVVDPNGAAVAGVKITLTRSDSKESLLTTLTDKEGAYRIVNLALGSYELKFDARGFKPLVITKVSVANTKSIYIEAMLMLADKTEWIGIIAETEPLIDRQSSEIKTIISGETIRRLPIHE